jgi:two-component system LytT family response regulator
MSRTLRVLIADDEELARKRLIRLCGEISGVEVVGQVENGAAALEALQEEPVDLLFLDISMPGMDGMAVAASLSEGGPQVIFCTAHPEPAVEAFRLGALDYLLKPVSPERLALAIGRARVKVPEEAASLPAGRIPLPGRKGIRLVRLEDIEGARIEGSSTVVDVIGSDGKKESLFVDLSLSSLEERLPRPPFLRIHRRALVNLEKVSLFEPVDNGGYLAHLQSGQRLAVSRMVSRKLRQEWG